MKKLKIKILIFVLMLFTVNAVKARDVNLDKIYIKKNSKYLYNLIDAKLELFNVIGASLVDKNIIFSGWTSGNRIIYVKEYLKQNKNIVYEYFPSSRIKKKLASIKGAIIFGRVSLNGHYLFLKRMIKKKNVIPENEIIIIDLIKKKRQILKSNFYFLDYTISFDGESIIYENTKGLVEYFPSQNKKRLLLKKSKYNNIRFQGNPVLAYQSPSKQNLLLISGGGGQYKAALYSNKRKVDNLSFITSATELFWLDNNRFVCRKGYTGYYQVAMYNINKKQIKNISKYSFNTNIVFSARNNIISFLQDGGLAFYQHKNNKNEKFPLEGEDIIFSPKGNSFCIIFNKTLFIAKQQSLYKKFIEMKRISKRILNNYKTLSKLSSNWDNRYSGEYIRRKIKLYKQYTK